MSQVAFLVQRGAGSRLGSERFRKVPVQLATSYRLDSASAATQILSGLDSVVSHQKVELCRDFEDRGLHISRACQVAEVSRVQVADATEDVPLVKWICF